jgi:hypothetical protein
LRVRHPQERIIVLAEAKALALELTSDEGMTVDPVAGLEGKKGADAQDHGAEHFVPNVEVVVSIARPVPFEDAVVRVVGRILGHQGTESGALFHAFEDEIDPEPLATFHADAVGPDQVFVLDALLGPPDGNAVVTSESFNPMLIVLGPLGQSLLGDGIDAVHVAEEMNDMLGASQQGQIALDDDTVETMVYQSQQAAKQLAEGVKAK